MADSGAWYAALVGLVLAALTWAVGAVVMTRVGVLSRDTQAAACAAVGLGVGLLMAASGYAVIRSGGMTSFTPVLVGLVTATILGHGSLGRRPYGRALAVGGLISCAVLLACAAIYGTTVSPSPRGGVQPVEFMDEAYYAILSSDLREIGREWLYSPSGFPDIEGAPEQTWYHWGEIWLGAAVLEVPGITSLQARHLVVLPTIVLATITLSGTLSRRIARSGSSEAFVLGAIGVASLAPVPLAFSSHFDWWAQGTIFNVTQYGLVAVAVLLVLVFATRARTAPATWSEVILVASCVAAVVALHVAIAVVLAAGIAVLVAWTAIVRPRRAMPEGLMPVLGSAAALVVATVAWGLITGHGLAGIAASDGVEPFAPAWQRATTLAVAGSGLLLIAPVALLALRRADTATAGMVVVAIATVAAGAVAWGFQYAAFNSFHLFYGAVAIVLTPIAVACAVALIYTERDAGRRVVATILLAGLLGQTAIGAAGAYAKLEAFGPRAYPPIALAALRAIADLPDGKLAYSCGDVEEFAFWDPRLISLKAHTGRTVVPMCFQADFQRHMLGAPFDPTIASPLFRAAPQRALYPTADARPSKSDLLAFFATHEVGYIYADAAHPNLLLPDARAVLRMGDVTVYEVP